MPGLPKSKIFWKKFMLGKRSKEGRIRADFKGEDIRGEDLKRNNPQEETSWTVSLIGEGTEGGDLEGNNK